MYADISTQERKVGRAASLVLLVLLCSVAASAQITLGDNLNMKMTGNLGFGYTGTFGNADLQSSHGQGFGANGLLTGFYFHPNFLSFDFRPYYDRQQSNTDSQTITRGSGVAASVSLFGGSRFPGTVAYGKDFSSNSEFRFAGLPSVVGDSAGSNFSIGWSALVPKWPQLRANYYSSSSDSSLLGATTDSHIASKNLTVMSDYRYAGWDIHGNFNAAKNNFTMPAFVTTEPVTNEGSLSSYGVNAQHKLPLSGNVGLGWTHSNYYNNGGNDSGTSSYSAGAGISPWRRLSVYQTVNYTTNLAVAFYRSVANVADERLLQSNSDSNSLLLTSGATWAVGHGFSLNGTYTHRRQNFEDRLYTDDQYGGSVNYNVAHRWLGLLYFGFGAIDSADKNGHRGLGFVANVGMSKKFGNWDTSADFNYSQNVQTMVSVATTSSYTFGGTVRRKINSETFWHASFRGSQSGLVLREGSGNNAQTYASSLSWRRYSFGGSYSQSNGTAVLNQFGGLTPTPIGSLISEDFLLFNARSVTANASARLFRRMQISGGYSRFTSGTEQIAKITSNEGDRYNARLEYRLRKFSLIGGYGRSEQDVSTIPGGPRIVNSYYISLSRWFNVF